MPEYLAPGVYLEEVDTGSKPIEGVSTSTTGMLGVTERGPVNEPTLVTGFADFTRQFGGFLNRRVFTGANWLLPHAVDGYFTNGGKRLFLVRVLPEAATYAELFLFGELAAGFESTLASRNRRGEGFFLVTDPAGAAAGEWLLVDDGARIEYIQVADGALLSLDVPLRAQQAAGDDVTPYTFAVPAGGLATNPTNPLAAGDTEILLDDVTGLNAADLVLRVGAGATREYVVTASVPGAAADPVQLADALAFDHPVTDDVELVDATAAPATDLLHPAAAGDRLIVVADETALAGADAVAFGAGNPTGFYSLGELGFAGVAPRLRFRHAAGTAIAKPTMTDLGNDRDVTADADAGTSELFLAKRDDLDQNSILFLTGPDGSEYVAIDAIDPEPGAGADDPGRVTLETPLLLRYPSGSTAHPFEDGAADSDETELARAGDSGDGTLLLVDGSAYGPGDTIRVDAAASPRAEYFDLVATQAGAIPLQAEPRESHPAATAVGERRPFLRARAIDRGAWGDCLRVTVEEEDAPTLDTTVRANTAATSPTLELTTAVGIEAGTVLEFYELDVDGEPVVTFVQKVESVNRNEVTFGPGGLEQDVFEGGRVRTAEFKLTVECVRTSARTGREFVDPELSEGLRNLTLDPRHSRYVVRAVGQIPRLPQDVDDPDPQRDLIDERGEGESALVRVVDLFDDATARAAERTRPDLLTQLTPDGQPQAFGLRLEGGGDALGDVNDDVLIGDDAVDPVDRTGLQALKNIEEISIVAAPGRTSRRVQEALLSHSELMRFRFAVLDSRRGPDPDGLRLEDVQTQRSLYDSKYGALYYPWLEIDDPFPRNPSVAEPVWIPPSGHVLGIFARSDIERGVHKAPANEVVRGINNLQIKLVKEQQDLINPRNINALRDFRDRGRGLRVWGARCVTSDPDWRYVNVRRLFNYIEASIERGTQWVVFEPNDHRLWARVTQSVSAFLTAVWRDGALMGRTAEQAFYVKCDETTMSQYDIDNGRLIMVIGIAPVKPAEFVVIRIGQWAGGSLVEEA